MACCFPCCSKAKAYTEKKPLVVDVHQVLTTQAWRMYKSTLGSCAKMFLKRKDFTIEVPDNYFVFEQKHQSITARDARLHVVKPGQEAISNNSSNIPNNNDDDGSMLAGKAMPKRDLTNPETINLDTEFFNDTASAQKYNFRFEKERSSTVMVSFQKGYTLGASTNFKIELPLMGSEAEASASMEYSVTNTEEQTFTETMTMEATTEIMVGPNSNYIAQVQLEEKKVMADFKVSMRMSMPQGKAPVYIKRKKDGVKVFVYHVMNLVDLFGYDQFPCAKEVKKEDGKVDDYCKDKIDFVVEGVIRGNLACNHKIQLRSDETREAKKAAQAKYIHGGQGGDN